MHRAIFLISLDNCPVSRPGRFTAKEITSTIHRKLVRHKNWFGHGNEKIFPLTGSNADPSAVLHELIEIPTALFRFLVVHPV
jgi:hypothetical protein